MRSFFLTDKSLKQNKGEESDILKRIEKDYENMINQRKNKSLKRNSSIKPIIKNIKDLSISIKIKNQNALNKRSSNYNQPFMNKTTRQKFFIAKNKKNINKLSKTESLNCLLKEKRIASHSPKKTKNFDDYITIMNQNKKTLSPIKKLIKNPNTTGYRIYAKNNKIYLKTDTNFFKRKINKKNENNVNYGKISSPYKKTDRNIGSVNKKRLSITQSKTKIYDNKNDKNNQNIKNGINKVLIDHMMKKQKVKNLKNFNKEKIYKNILNNKNLKILYNIDKNKINKMIECQSTDNKMKMTLQEYQKNLIENNSTFITNNNKRILIKSFQCLYDNRQLKNRKELIRDYIKKIQKMEFEIIDKNNKDNVNLINKFLEIGISPLKFDIKIDTIDCQNVLDE